MKILITGVYGIIGSYLCQRLKENGHYIVGIGKREEYEKCHKYYSCDITNYNNLEKVLKENKDIDIIIHAAALAHNKGNDLSKESFIKINYEGTKNLIDLSNKCTNLKNFVFLSTISVYGERLNIEEYKEYETLLPKSPYAVAKKMSEEYIKSTCKSNYSILRLAPVYSKDFKLNIQRRTSIKGIGYTVGKGEKNLSLCNIKNIYLSIDYIIKNYKDERNNIYNISASKTYSYKELLKYVNKKRVIVIPNFLMKALYNFNKAITKNVFIEENSIKLLSNNTYPNDEINKKVKLKYNIEDD